MRVIKPSTCRKFWEANSIAERPLRLWLKIAGNASWSKFTDIKQSFGVRVDLVKVDSRKTVFVFDIANNNLRLVCAIHFNTQIIYVLRIMTHREYDLNRWKREL